MLKRQNFFPWLIAALLLAGAAACRSSSPAGQEPIMKGPAFLYFYTEN